MANQETQKLDSIIASRRSMLLGGGAALAALAMGSTKAEAALTPASYTDFDILNFALNLEYLEANFYYMAAFGCTIDNPNSAATAAGAAKQSIGSSGVAATTTGATIVPFTIPAVKAYAIETAIEEGKHVSFIQNAITCYGGTAVSQPAISLTPTTFNVVASAAGVGAPFLISGAFSPYANDFNFLAGAYIFEDVGVTAYRGAAPLISTGATGKVVLQAAASILAVEAYHAGLIRSTIFNADPANAGGYLTGTQKISALRATLAHAVAPSPVPAYPNAASTYSDDFGLYPGTYPQPSGTGQSTNPPATGTVTLGTVAGQPASNIANADPTFVVAPGRTTTQVLNIVTAGGAATSGSKATGGFFPNGLNGTFA